MKKRTSGKAGPGFGRLLSLWGARLKGPSPAPRKSAMMVYSCSASSRGESWRVTGSRLSLDTGGGRRGEEGGRELKSSLCH